MSVSLFYCSQGSSRPDQGPAAVLPIPQTLEPNLEYPDLENKGMKITPTKYLASQSLDQ